MNDSAPVNDILPEDLIDRAYDLMCAELDHWQCAGPFEEAGKPNKKFFWVAVRRESQDGYAKILPGLTADPNDSRQLRQYFSTKAHAVAFIQWNGLKAVLSDRQLRERIIGIGAG